MFRGNGGAAGTAGADAVHCSTVSAAAALLGTHFAGHCCAGNRTKYVAYACHPSIMLMRPPTCGGFAPLPFDVPASAQAHADVLSAFAAPQVADSCFGGEASVLPGCCSSPCTVLISDCCLPCAAGGVVEVARVLLRGLPKPVASKLPLSLAKHARSKSQVSLPVFEADGSR